jgi:hypothetical protein
LDDSPEDNFLIDQLEDGYLPDGRPVCVADVVSPASCPAIEQIAHDPNILALFRASEGYSPRSIRIRLFWYLALEPSHPANAFLPNHGGLYHYDVVGFDSMYVYFYLTDVDRDCGAHAMIEGSHKCKTLSMLFGNRYYSDARIHQHYDESFENIIERKFGYGFVEDPNCFHKYCICQKRNRLMLQFRYF